MKTLSERLAVIRATLSLLYQCNPRAFTISAIASLPEPLFFPTIIFLLKKLFEDNSFQARYGLVIREASYRSITLVDTLLSTGPILLGLIGLAVTLFVIAPLMVVVLLVIAIPATLIERRFSDAMYDLQEGTAPARLRLEAITNMQVDSLWQRDVRVYRTDLLTREHAFLAESYLTRLKQLTARFLGLRGAAASVQVIGLGLALVAVGALINRGQLTLANLAVLIPGTAFLSGMIGAFIYLV